LQIIIYDAVRLQIIKDDLAISRLGYVSGTVGIDENGGYIVWFGTHITINLLV
jgi:hypothetical protein